MKALILSLVLTSLLPMAHAAVVLEIDASDLSAVTFTATSAVSAVQVDAVTVGYGQNMNNGLQLEGIFQAGAVPAETYFLTTVPSSGLFGLDEHGDLTSQRQFYDAGYVGNYGGSGNAYTPFDFCIYSSAGLGGIYFTPTEIALTGSVTYDFSGYGLTAEEIFNPTGAVYGGFGQVSAVDSSDLAIGTFNVTFAPVPEPTTAALGAIGLLALLRRRRVG